MAKNITMKLSPFLKNRFKIHLKAICVARSVEKCSKLILKSIDICKLSMVSKLGFNKTTDNSLPPMPNKPDHPGQLPPNIPIPGEPTGKGKMHKHEYTCKKCGKVFNSKQELKTHLKTDHAT